MPRKMNRVDGFEMKIIGLQRGFQRSSPKFILGLVLSNILQQRERKKDLVVFLNDIKHQR